MSNPNYRDVRRLSHRGTGGSDRLELIEARAIIARIREAVEPVATAPLPVGYDDWERHVQEFAAQILAILDKPKEPDCTCTEMITCAACTKETS